VGILQTIVSQKRQTLKNVKASLPLRYIREKIADAGSTRDFRSAVKRPPNTAIRLIAEIKKASPSQGIIRKNFDHLSIARTYEEKHVDAISVLTEEDFFEGNISFIPQVKKITSRPVLRKDFIFDDYQIFEARAFEADAILLIAAILERNQAAEYLHLARELGLSVLFEIHGQRELEIALSIGVDMVGINNRNLDTLQVDLNTTITLRKFIPTGVIVVSESGIRSRENVMKLEELGVDALLIGSSLMAVPDIGQKIDELRGSP